MTDTISPRSWRNILKRERQQPQNPQAMSQTRMMNAAEEFHQLRVDDVMVPRADIIAVETTSGLHDVAKIFREAGHSRLPVYRDTLDEPLGIIHIKDLLPYLMLDAKGRSGKTYPDKRVIQYIRRPVLFVPPSMQAQDLLRRMQAKRMHMAIVVDEYGGTDGIVTLEDLLERIVGDIEDEHDDTDAMITHIAGTGDKAIWEADARVVIDDFEKAFGRDFATPDEEDDVDTLGGLVFTLAGRVPERGEIIYHPDGIEFEVIDADPRRVKRLRIQNRQPGVKETHKTDASKPDSSASTQKNTQAAKDASRKT